MSHDYVTIDDTDVRRDQLRAAIADFDGGTGEAGALILADDGCPDDDVSVIICGDGMIALRSLERLKEKADDLPEFQGWQMEKDVASKGSYNVYADGEGDIWMKHDADDVAVLFTDLSTNG